MHPLLADPWISAQVDTAVAPYVGTLPDAEIAWMRDQLADRLASSERAAKLLRRSQPTVVLESGEVRRERPTDTDTDAPAAEEDVPERPKAAG